jgi:hypothetical protein
MTITTIGIIIVLFSTSVQGATTTIRPLDDWAGEDVLDWADLDTGLVISPHSVEWSGVDFPFNFLNYEMQPLSECESNGFIKERVLDEEHTIITIYMHVKEVPFMLFTMPNPDDYPPDQTPPYYMFPPKYSGTMKYYFQCRIIFNTESLYRILNDYPDGKIPSLFEIVVAANPILNPIFWPYQGEPAPLMTFIHFEGDGHITAAYPDPVSYPNSVPCDGKVLVNQVGIWDPDLGDFRWPHDSVLIK